MLWFGADCIHDSYEACVRKEQECGVVLARKTHSCSFRTYGDSRDRDEAERNRGTRREGSDSRDRDEAERNRGTRRVRVRQLNVNDILTKQ